MTGHFHRSDRLLSPHFRPSAGLEPKGVRPYGLRTLLSQLLAQDAESVGEVDVLVVDDEQGVAESAAEVLRSAGFTAMTAHDVDGALAMASAHSFKVFVLDHMLGHDTCEPILQHAEHLPPVVIVSAAHPDDLARVKQRHRKVFSIKTKPCDPQDLIETIRKATTD